MKKIMSMFLVIALILTIPMANVTKVSAEQSGDYTYYVNNNTATITGYTGKGGNISIPKTLGGNPVTIIDDWAFENNNLLTGVTIPEGVTEIRYQAFYNCSLLKTVTIPNSVSIIGEGAFQSCVKLTGVLIPNAVTSISRETFFNCSALISITIPNNVVVIGRSAFSGCKTVTKVSIPASVKSIESYAFSNCEMMTQISVDSNNSKYSSIGGVLFNKTQTSLIQYPGGKKGIYTIPYTVTEIEGSAFSGSNGLTHVNIPKSVLKIGHSAFSYTGLTGVSIPGSITVIGRNVFSHCSKLAYVNIPKSVTDINIYAFRNCGSFNAFNVETENANFSGVDGVLLNKDKSSVLQYPEGKTGNYTIPASVKNIGENAFRNCSKLYGVTIPSNILEIGSYSFYDCVNLTNINILNGVESIGDYAFSGCTKLTAITLPKSVSRVGIGLFNYCKSLTQIIVDNDNSDFSSNDNVLFSKDGSELIAYPCGKSGSYSLPDNVNSITYYAFDWCNKLTAINAPDSNVTYSSIDGVLFNKEKTTLVRCPGGKTGNYFIPENVLNIGDYAFFSCNALLSVTFPKSVTNIGEYAFYGCSNMNAAYFLGNAPILSGHSTFLCAPTFKAYYIKGNTGFTQLMIQGEVVEKEDIPVTGIILNRQSVTLEKYSKLKLIATVNPSNTIHDLVTWKSSNTKIATVSQTGEITAIAPGATFITATTISGAKIASCKVTVKISVKSVKLNRTSLSLKKGKTYKLVATINPSNATNKKVTWKSGNRAVARVGATGIVKGIKKGTTYIYVYTVDGKKSARCKVTVN